jgi:hypothetical protein
MKRITLLTGIFLLVGGATASTQFLGGHALFHTWTAQNLEPGQLSVKWQSRFWSGSTSLGGVSNVTQAVALTFGFSPHVELEVTPILYQDINFNPDLVTYNAPDDVYFRMRFGGYRGRVMSNPIQWGLQASARTNSSRVSNVYLEPYSNVSNEVSLGGTVSWFANQLYPAEGPSAHANLTYLNHNDGGASSINIFSGSTNDLEFAFAYRYPTLHWELFGELYGNVFLTDPPDHAYTRADAIWLQPGFTWRFFQGMSLTAGLDLRVLESGPAVHYGAWPAGAYRQQYRPNDEFPAYYPPWRMSVKMAFTPSTTFRHSQTFSEVRLDSQKDWEMREKIGVTEREMIDWLGAEDQSAEFLDLELEKIRAERRQAEKELEKLKDKLKDDKGK